LSPGVPGVSSLAVPVTSSCSILLDASPVSVADAEIALSMRMSCFSGLTDPVYGKNTGFVDAPLAAVVPKPQLGQFALCGSVAAFRDSHELFDGESCEVGSPR
jgi:hypothetical protein